MIKRVIEKIKLNKMRMLKDQLYPVKIDNIAIRIVLKPDEIIQEETISFLEKKNDMKIAKIIWLSNKKIYKTYDLMIIYFVRDEQTIAILQNGFFSIYRESAHMMVFLSRTGSVQYYYCQKLGYKTYNYKRNLCYIRCDQQEYSHRECSIEILRYMRYNDLYEMSSKTCFINQDSSLLSL